MKFVSVTVLVLLLIVGQSTVILMRPSCRKATDKPTACDKDNKSVLAPCMADSLADLLTKVADPKNRHFEDFQRHFGKVIDTLDPETDPAKINSRVEKFVSDIGTGLNSFDKHHPNCA